jgi:uncharacterized protein with NAD-binding domain and iron-sulfur cluster
VTPEGGRVLILGGGMAGLSTAWALSRPGWRERFESITVVQRGWRLGGKGASGRGRHGRTEEHGLHVWLGYYDNAFRLVRQVYDELDRPDRDPDAPIQTWRDAFVPAGRVGLAEQVAHDVWRPWIADFTPDGDLPGDEDAGAEPMSVDRFVRRGLTLLADFARNLPAGDRGPRATGLGDGRSQVERIAEYATGELLRRFGGRKVADGVRQLASTRLVADARWRRTFELVDLVATSVLGVWRDRLFDDPRGFSAVNDEDYREWMRRHGAAESTLASPLVNGVYDLVFGYQDGDPDRPAFAAGVGLVLSAKMFFEYRGSVFWKMTAGMGDVVFAPLYEALLERGVRFEFFTEVLALHPSADRRSIDGVTVADQVELIDPTRAYEPLVRVKGLPCWPSTPRSDQLRVEGRLDRTTLETYGRLRSEVGRRRLQRGHDYDELVFALPAGVIGIVGGELAEVSRRWRNVARYLGTVATQSAQVWLTERTGELASTVAGATVAGFGHPLDTYADMSQLLTTEDWSGTVPPMSLAYFCSTMRTGDGTDAEHVRAALAERLATGSRDLWPGAVLADAGFRWELLTAPADVVGEARLDHQYWQANADPSDRYVQSLPGSDRFRLAPDESGFEHLVLAGDWTHNGLNAGCIEAAVRSGLQAANVMLGRPLHDGVAGFYPA